jgi:NAD(P)-dependent dehydrogenase (short-subunit alcohol dehydrogenase family)
MVAHYQVQTFAGGDVEEMWRRRDAMSPTGKQGEPWDVAYAALFLASDEAKYVNGALLVVDGGLTCKLA